MTQEYASTSKPLIWDISTRLFHWFLVSLLVFQWLTAEYLDNAMDWHLLGGYSILGLVTFRILWGFIGPKYARFSQFIYQPKVIWEYAKTITNRNSDEYASHNPMGGLAVILMLLLVLGQAISGLFIDDDIVTMGPWQGTIPENLEDIMKTLHVWCFDILLYVIGLHILAIIFYERFKKQTLLAAMIHGRKNLSDSGITSQKVILALIVTVVVAVLVYVVVEVLPPPQDDYYF